MNTHVITMNLEQVQQIHRDFFHDAREVSEGVFEVSIVPASAYASLQQKYDDKLEVLRNRRRYGRR